MEDIGAVRSVGSKGEDATVAAPPLFARNIVQGKSYDLAEQSVAPYFRELLHLLLGTVVEIDLSEPWHRSGPVFGDPRLAPYRLGQQSFQAVVLSAYHRRCAISGTHIPHVLQAAHIRPVTSGGEQFYARAGQVIDLPDRRADRPQSEFLEWHLDEVFMAS